MNIQKTRFRIAKLCGKFGSPNDHEVLAAARKAHELTKRIGFSWDELIGYKLQESETLAAIRFCVLRKDMLSEAEQDFVLSMNSWVRDKPMTEKQERWFNSIYERLRELEVA